MEGAIGRVAYRSRRFPLAEPPGFTYALVALLPHPQKPDANTPSHAYCNPFDVVVYY